MKRILTALCVTACVFTVTARADGLDDFLNSINVEARLDQDGFSARVSAQFGVPEARVKVVLSTVSEPADAFMIFQLGQMTQQPPERVVEVYKAQKGKGWGVMAKQLGIKPGSAEFHALKNGNFHLGGKSDEGSGKEKGKGKGKDKGKSDK